jgi:hypothetical protein
MEFLKDLKWEVNIGSNTYGSKGLTTLSSLVGSKSTPSGDHR